MWRCAAIAVLLLALSPASSSADGGPERSFGDGGSRSFAPQRFSGAAGVAVDAQGRTLVGATLDDGSLLRTRAAVLRLLADGSLDASFGSAGVAEIPPPAPYTTSRAEAIALDPQGRIVVAGEVGDDVPAVARLLPTGALDPAFAGSGVLVAPGAYHGWPGGWRSVALDGSSIVLAGAVDSAPPFGNGLGRIAVVARLGDDGVPDATFASGGFLTLPVPGVTFASGRAAAVDSRGRIVLGIWRATTIAFPGDVAAAVVRITHAGALDGSFGDGGMVALGALQGRAPSISLARSGAIVALGGWTARRGGLAIAARLLPSGKLDDAFGEGGELAAAGAPPAVGVLDCQGDLIAWSTDGVRRYGPDGRVDPRFRGSAIPRVFVGDTTAVAGFDSLALTPAGAVVLSGTAADGPTTIGGSAPTGHNAIAVARVTATCPVVDTTPPAVTLACSPGCRRVTGSALDDPAGSGVRRVLLGIERRSGGGCEAWNGRRFSATSCKAAAARLVRVPLVRGSFRTPLLGTGRFVVRAVAVDRAGHRSRVAVRLVRR